LALFLHTRRRDEIVCGIGRGTFNPVGFFAGFRSYKYKNIHREKERIHLMTTEIRNSINGLLLIPLVLACFALLPSIQATPDPANPGGANTADGGHALQNRSTGEFNTAFGTNALNSLTTGFNNAAQGNSALFSLTTGGGNVAIGSVAQRFNQDGNHNTAIGNNALNANLHGNQNTAIGYSALRVNTSNDNTAVGWGALGSHTSGTENVAVGKEALANLSVSGSEFNTAVGTQALVNQTSGDNNVALGEEAGVNVSSGGSNVFLGAHTGASVFNGTGIVCIGYLQNSDNISDRTFIKNIGSFAQPTGGVIDFVTVNTTNNKMGHTASSRRYKEDIKPMDNSSELIYQLKPMTFRFKKNAENPNPVLDYGLIAEDVAEVDPALAIRNGEGQIESVRYLAIQNMLLNEFLKEHKKVQELEATVAQQKKDMGVFAAALKEQAAQIQKVSAQVEVNKAAPRTVANK
jgi:hypothetical protein